MSYVLSHYQPSVTAFQLMWCVVPSLSRVNAAARNPLQFTETATRRRMWASVTLCVLTETQKRERERETSAPNRHVRPMSEPGSILPSCVSLSIQTQPLYWQCWRRREGGGRLLPVYGPASQPEFIRFNPDQSVIQVHFFLPDFSERFPSDFPPRSDLSDLSPLSLSFSFSRSFSFSLSACSIFSARSERSPPRSDLLSALLPSRRVPSSVDEVVGWGWPHLAISSCSVILAVILVTHVLRSSCDGRGDHRCLVICMSLICVSVMRNRTLCGQ